MIGALGGVDQFLRETCEGVQKSRVAKKCWNEARAPNKTSKAPYTLLHGVLYYESDGLRRVYVPDHRDLRARLLELYHSTLLLVILVLKNVIVLH
jgi:hypothetical protein